MPGDGDKSTAESSEYAATIAGGSSAETDPSADTVADTGEREAADKKTHGEAGDGLDDLLGVTLQERYKINCKIGQGGMGAVYEATHLALGKKVAIKVLLDKHADKESVVARLEQEARLASSIGHDHIIDITDFGTTASGRTFVVMEYLEGESLGQCLAREGPFDPSRAIPIVRQAAGALGAAHQSGVIHRDVKPENLFLRRRNNQDSVKVVDFGISKAMTPDEGEESPRLTQTGMVLGTPLYMSPEQARGDDNPDHRVDIYALGVILYECVTGDVPFTGTNYLSIVSQVISTEPKTPRERRPELSRDLEDVILKAIAKEPEDRYQTMAEFDADLAVLAEGSGMGSGMGTTAARLTASRRRKKSQKGRLTKTIKWAASAATVASLVVIAVILSTYNRVDNNARNSPQTVVSPSATDASIPSVHPDAQATPIYEFAVIRINSKPHGATVFRGDREEGVTPVELNLLKSNQRVKIFLELEGYDDATTELSPLEDDGKNITLRLTKAKKTGARRRRHKSLGRRHKSLGQRHTKGKKGGNGDENQTTRGPGHQNGGGDLTPPPFEP